MTPKIIALFTGLLATAACTSLPDWFDPSALTYRRDVRTGLCFAALPRAKTIANVPCTPAVINRLPQGERPTT